ncbi:hypothetical protein P5G65_15470 [Paenibacillus chondroitinus]|uniref:Uncharacterized protein n=1 Tax=Paenibacillus chondroitinus TaxID=59842 RepID=A0ABU6DC53_9BACL|nr:MULTISPECIES: hypothetical protein [Paenibacillus]MCY9656480.1 hypothetical protein [Paenibacillus anseongense]MEB4795304.1 hypothetical protein [Paenibacillus chondroitinus]
MLNSYSMEKLMQFQQHKIEAQARHAWKWDNIKESKPDKLQFPMIVPQTNLDCCPACC